MLSKANIDESKILNSVWKFGRCGGTDFATSVRFKENGTISASSPIGEEKWEIKDNKLNLINVDGNILSFILSSDKLGGDVLFATHWADSSTRVYLLEITPECSKDLNISRLNYISDKENIPFARKNLNLNQTLRHLHSVNLVEEKSSFFCPKPNKSFKGQSFFELERSFPHEGIEKNDTCYSTSDLKIYLCTIKNGYFFVGHGLDGTIFTEDFHPIDGTTMFNRHEGLGINDQTKLDIDVLSELDEAFVGFDFFWGNYFHFLNFFIAKSYIAKTFLGDELPIVFPNCDKQYEHWSAYSNVVRDQAFQFSGINKNIRLLPRGAYKVKKLHFLVIERPYSWAILFSDGLINAYNAMSRYARRSDSIGDNVYVCRGKNVNSRLTGKTDTVIQEAVAKHRFLSTSFEKMDLQQQISIAKYAKKIISPHGAGLTNILFNPGDLGVLEINRKLDGVNQGYRPCFYMASAVRDHNYFMLDADELDKSPWQINEALQAMNR